MGRTDIVVPYRTEDGAHESTAVGVEANQTAPVLPKRGTCCQCCQMPQAICCDSVGWTLHPLPIPLGRPWVVNIACSLVVGLQYCTQERNGGIDWPAGGHIVVQSTPATRTSMQTSPTPASNLGRSETR